VRPGLPPMGWLRAFSTFQASRAAQAFDAGKGFAEDLMWESRWEGRAMSFFTATHGAPAPMFLMSEAPL